MNFSLGQNQYGRLQLVRYGSGEFIQTARRINTFILGLQFSYDFPE